VNLAARALALAPLALAACASSSSGSSPTTTLTAIGGGGGGASTATRSGGAGGSGGAPSTSTSTTSSPTTSADGAATTSSTSTGSGGAGGASDPGPCKHEGGLSCGQDGIGGSPDTLYVCSNGHYVVDHVCQGACDAMPSGVPDRCPEDAVVPASLVKVLAPKPYVEDACVPTKWVGWPYDAQKCTYSVGGITTSVTVADPTAAVVAAWIVDSAIFVPSLWKLRLASPSDWEAGLREIALHTLGQSSRIFPLEGGIIENMGGGYVNYPFDRGVTKGCSSGCYCRINSLHRTEWCGYQAFLGPGSYDDCIAKVGASGLTDAWGDECLSNHVAAWTSTRNEHYRAKAWKVNESVSATCGGGKCSPAEVVTAVHAALQ
jgi:hypothetical protein